MHLSISLFSSRYIFRILRRYYHCQRQADLRNTARTTIRLLESLIRLAQAHARLMFRGVVTVQDAIVAVTCVECSMQNSALLGSMNALHTRFPDDPCEEYSRQAKLILKRLKLDDMIAAIDNVESRAGNNSTNVGGCELEAHRQSALVTENNNGNRQSLSSNTGASRLHITSEDFNTSLNELTDVSTITSSEVKMVDFVGEATEKNGLFLFTEDSCEQAEVRGSAKSSAKRTTQFYEQSNDICGKTTQFAPDLTTAAVGRETFENQRAASLDRSKQILQMFSRKPIRDVTQATAFATNSKGCKVQNGGTRDIFTTEELDEDELESA